MTRALGAGARPAMVQAAAVGLLAVLLYAPVLQHDFVNWDDDRVLLDNPAVTRADGLGRIWSSVELPEGFPNYPLTFTSYWIEYRLWGAQPAGYHAVNALLHGLNAGLVFALLARLGLAPWAAMFAAALFAVHPMQVESVAWIAERKNVLATVFALGTCLAYLRWRAARRPAAYAAALALFAAALLSKTAVLVLPLSLLLLERLRDGSWRRAPLLHLSPLLAMSAAAAAATLLAERAPVAVPLLERPLIAVSALWFYAGKLLVPIVLLPIYPRWDVSLADPRWWAPVGGVLAVAVLLYRWPPAWPVRWGLGHFVCLLLPVLGLVSFGFSEYSFVADHHVYLASVGACAAAAVGVQRLHRRAPRGTVAGAVALLALLGTLTWRQTAIWRDSVTLWSYELAYRPRLWVAQNNLALALIARGRPDAAVPLLEAALSRRPTDSDLLNNLALAFYRQGDFAAAVGASRRAAEIDPQATGLAKNLGLALAAQGDLRGAERELRRAVALSPAAPELRYLLADVLHRRGDRAGAVAELDRSLALGPELDAARALRARLAAGAVR